MHEIIYTETQCSRDCYLPDGNISDVYDDSISHGKMFI